MLYRLTQTQRVSLVYRGGRFDQVQVFDVVPRRVRRDTETPITISVLGATGDLQNIKAYVVMFVGNEGSVIKVLDE